MSRSLQDSVPPVDLSESIGLIGRAQRGDQEAVAALLVRYEERLRRIVRIRMGARLRATMDSVDIVQDVFVAAANQLSQAEFKHSGAVLNWLACIAQRRLLDEKRRMHAIKRDIGRNRALDFELDGSSIGWAPADPGDSPSQVAARSELGELIDSTLCELDEPHREVILLRHYCGGAWPEVASELGRSVGATQELHRRARMRLREKLAPKLGDWSPE